MLGRIKPKIDKEIKKSITSGTSNEVMIKELILKISHVRDHVNRLHKMMDWDISEILMLKVNNDKPLSKHAGESEANYKDESMEEKVESDYEPEEYPSEDEKMKMKRIKIGTKRSLKKSYLMESHQIS